MASARQLKILIVEDDLGLAEMLQAFLRAEGYAAVTAAWGQKALDMASTNLPDLIVLDIRLPDIDGFDVCQRLRESHQTRHIPIIFLTERRDRVDRLRGLEMGVLDYITKPFDIQELRLRVQNHARRILAGNIGNPVTGLLQGQEVLEALQRTLNSDSAWGMLAVTLHGLATFREVYGFVAGDEVLRVVSLTLSHAVDEIVGAEGFYGHLEDQTFVLVVAASQLGAVYERIVERIAGSLEYFYPGDDRGPLAHTPDRLGLSIGRLTALQGPFDSVAALIQTLLASRQAVSAAARQ